MTIDRRTRRGTAGYSWIAAVIALTTIAAAPAAYGHAVDGALVTVHQPDGTSLQVRVWGDEYASVMESLDGYTLIRDTETGFVCYARPSPDGQDLASTGVATAAAGGADLGLALHLRAAPRTVQTHRAAAHVARVVRASAVLAGGGTPVSTKTGQVNGVCVLVDFPDDPGTISPSEVDRLLNQTGYTGYGNNGSLRDYYRDASYGKLLLHHYVPTKYFRAPNNKAYYESGSYNLVDQLVTQALTALNAEGLDFSQFDANNDGFIDSIICLYAGTGTGGLWPHGGQGTAFQANGVQGWNNIVLDLGSRPAIQTLCHEMGHSVCEWPDLYDTDGVGGGVGFYCVMGISLDTNDNNPPPPCAVLKDMNGWTDTHVLAGTQDGLTLAAGGTLVYKFANPALAKEYFMLENREQTGRDANLPSAGLAIWHVDLTKDDNTQQQGTATMHYMVSLVQADGQRHLEKNDLFADGQDLYAGAGAVFSPTSTPRSDWWNGTPSNVTIHNIGPAAATLSFSFTTGPVTPDTSGTSGDNSSTGDNSGNTTDQPTSHGGCGAGVAQMFPVILLQLMGLRVLGRRRA